MTRDTYFFKWIHHKHITEQSDEDWITFSVTILIYKVPSQVEFHPYALTLAYQQHDCNSWCFSSLESSFVVLEYFFCKLNLNAYHFIIVL